MNPRLKASLLLIGVFLAGAAAGAGLLHFAHRGPPHRMGGPHGLTELGLTSDQENRTREIFDAYKPQLDALFGEIRPRLDTLRHQMDGEIKQVLTPAQVAKFDEMNARRGKELQGPPPGRPPGPPPGPPPSP